MFKLCVTHFKVAPSEAWGLDIVDIYHLLENKDSESIDTSIMLNFERVQNGADKAWLQKH
jgi:hypothetical protein